MTDAPSIRRLARLPTQGLQAVETTDGQLLYVSDNGRYLIRGTAYDLWHGAELTSLTQAEDLAGRIDLKRLKLDPADLGALDTGTGPAVLAFVDPHCPHCADLLADLPSLTDRYRFRLIPLPIGAASQTAVLALHCLAATDPAAALKALFEHTDPPPGDARRLWSRDRPTRPGHRATARCARHPLADRARRAPPPGPPGGPGRLVGGGGDGWRGGGRPMIRALRSWPGLLALITGVATALAGCAGDNTRYACAGYPSKPLCLPPSAIYGLTQGAGPAPTAEPRPSTLVGTGVRNGDESLPNWRNSRTATGAKP